MAISTYSELQTAVSNWMVRSDLAGSAAEFITLAESRLTRKLPLREMWTTAPLTGAVDARTIALPTDYVEAAFLKLTTDGGRADPITPYTVDTLPYTQTSGSPCGWAVDGATIALDRPCDQAHTFDFRYRQRFSLSDGSPTNWLLTNHPDVYLAAVLMWGGAFVKNINEAVQWKGLLDEAIEELTWIEGRGDALAPQQFDPALVSNRRFDLIRGE